MSRWALSWPLLVALCLAASTATAGECKKIIADVKATDFYVGCSYDGEDYLWCIDAPVTGNLGGTWSFYSRPEDNFIFETIPDVLGIGSWDVLVVWALGVFKTHKGDILTQETDLLNLEAYDAYFALSSMAHIIGGTGEYEGATGWLGVVATETEGGTMRGMVCTP